MNSDHSPSLQPRKKNISTGSAAVLFKNMSVLEKLTYFLGVGLGSGLSPKAPGTAGSIAVLIFIPLWILLGTDWSIVVIALAAIIGIPICGKTAQLMGVHDDGRIVWDEFVGQSMAIIPLIFFAQVTLLNVALAFVFFRLFDIWKPWPIRYFDRNVHGGFGIMFDDILAGLMAMFAVWGWLALHIA